MGSYEINKSYLLRPPYCCSLLPKNMSGDSQFWMNIKIISVPGFRHAR